MPLPTGAPAWRDEFSGKTLDRTKWSFDTSRNAQGWYNGELQYYAADRRENLRLENGVLIIEARNDPAALKSRPDYGKQQYSAAKITTQGKASWTYGFYEIRAKVPCAYGTWPAVWMMPEGSYPWPKGGEIDILEHVGSKPRVLHANLHTELFNHAIKTGRGAERTLETACSAFHNYQLDWRPDAITVGVDGRAFMRVKNDQPGGHGAWPFDKPFYMILNLAIGGDWAAPKGMDPKVLPQRFEVDYVRVWSAAK
ncbi:glycoside hydrolase family 16 protein [Sphingomonas piscis]|uniref:Glycoside hydrolase family 16 protein n=2 Tax=Sphingomonas piscis TaxID=2714943 RepID=A0A6G7YTB7_9SPHN|nr:glycoside hydrolase family 16 protein [Sphingomonas piscis]